MAALDSESLFENCAACGKSISKSAAACPQCGHKPPKSNKAKIAGLVFIGFIILASIGGKDSPKQLTASSQQANTTAAAASPAASASAADKWEQNVDVSKIDDSTVVNLSLPANNEIKAWLTSALPSLHIRCKENATELFIVTHTSADVEGMYDEHTVEIRLDKGQMFKQRWSASTDNNALFAPNAIALSQKIAAAHKMVVRFTPFNANPQVMEFDVAGLDGHLALVAETCKWPYKNTKEKK